MDFKNGAVDDEGDELRRKEPKMSGFVPALLVVLFLVVPGLLAVLGMVADTRDPEWSVGRLLDSRPREDC